MFGSGKEDDTFEKTPIEDLEKVRRQIQKRLRGQTARQRRAKMLSPAAATPRKPGLSSALAVLAGIGARGKAAGMLKEFLKKLGYID